jgi:hypothetical protein
MKYSRYPDCCEKETCNSSCNNNIYIYPPEPPTPIERELVFAQVVDPNLSYDMTANGPIQIASNPDLLLQQGGFTLSTTTVPYDTLNLPGKGIYSVNVNLQYSFLPPNNILIGTPYQVVVGITTNNPSYIPAMANDTGIATPDTISNIMPSSMILNITNDNPTLGLELINFNFNVAFQNKISIYNHVINVVKLSDNPL